jgi:hypothetical protein
VADQNPIVVCGSCGGSYRRRLPDGLEYFHACPPLSALELKDAIAKQTITLTPEQLAVLDAAAKADKEKPPAEGEASATDRALATITVERPNKRDENVTGPGEPGKPAPIKSPGAGVAVK